MAEASKGDFSDHVALSLSGASATAGVAASYQVRALSEAGPSEPSSAAQGHRGVGSLAYQWERSDADADADYIDAVNWAAQSSSCI